MKLAKLNILIKSSVKTRKLSSAFFCIFVILSTVLMLLSIGLILPMTDNVVNKINNHISRRELETDFTDNIPDDYIESKITKLKENQYVTDVYKIPSKLTFSDSSKTLSSQYTLAFVHNESSPLITSGRTFDESETGVALVPEKIKDYNENERKFSEINGEDLIGKTLELNVGEDTVFKIKIIGAYSTSDPIFENKEILVPKNDLFKYDAAVSGEYSGDKSYMIVVDKPENTETALQELSGICNVYKRTDVINVQTYNTAMYISLATAVLFIAFVIVGFFIFLKNNISNRTNELALYRALGYKTKHIFYIIFTEHIILALISIFIGIIFAFLLGNLLINPYIYSLLGNTIMEMTVKITIGEISTVILMIILLLFIVCKTAVKRSEKTDLTVLLRER